MDALARDKDDEYSDLRTNMTRNKNITDNSTESLVLEKLMIAKNTQKID